MLFFLASSRFAAVIAAFDAGNGFADGDNRGGAVAAEIYEFDGLEMHGDFLVYNWPEKAFWLSDSNKLSPASLEEADASRVS